MTSDSITFKSWKLLIDRTFQKRDSYQNNNDLENYIKTNASLCVHIHTLFCGCKARRNLAPNCARFQRSSLIALNSNCPVTSKPANQGQTSIFLMESLPLFSRKSIAIPFAFLCTTDLPARLTGFFYIINRLLVLEMEFCCRNPNPSGLSLLHKR